MDRLTLEMKTVRYFETWGEGGGVTIYHFTRYNDIEHSNLQHLPRENHLKSRSVQCEIGPIDTIRHVTVLSSFPLHSVRLICVHTVVLSPSGIARDTRPALISINYAASFIF